MSGKGGGFLVGWVEGDVLFMYRDSTLYSPTKHLILKV